MPIVPPMAASGHQTFAPGPQVCASGGQTGSPVKDEDSPCRRGTVTIANLDEEGAT
jgi:hypothetical protein